MARRTRPLPRWTTAVAAVPLTALVLGGGLHGVDQDRPPVVNPALGTATGPAPSSTPSVSSLPASVSDLGVDGREFTRIPGEVVAATSTAAIPSAALAAYQRAETVINTADKSCNMTWQLLAGIGRVESDHGRHAGSNTTRTPDTDAGQYDDDVTYDRSVGPFQLIPSTWSVVGVDADNDGQRNPRDIDDAALASAVYLCSGDDDLSTTTGQRNAVYGYHHSRSYVDLVLSIMDSYLATPPPAAPGRIVSAGSLPTSPVVAPPGPRSLRPPDQQRGAGAAAPQAEVQVQVRSETVATGEPVAPSVPASSPVVPPDVVPPEVVTPVEPSPEEPVVDRVPLTLDEAVEQCTLDGLVDDPNATEDEFDLCLVELTAPLEPDPSESARPGAASSPEGPGRAGDQPAAARPGHDTTG